ncbi:hypothetical protein D3C86_1782830 [compost metagenome]
MDYEFDIILVDSHPESVGRNQNVELAGNPFFLKILSVSRSHSCVEKVHILELVIFEIMREFFRFLSCSCINDSRSLILFEEF